VKRIRHEPTAYKTAKNCKTESRQRESPGVRLTRANYEQIRSAMTGAGYITDQQFEQDIANLDNPIFDAIATDVDGVG